MKDKMGNMNGTEWECKSNAVLIFWEYNFQVNHERHACPSKPGKLKLESVFQVFAELVGKENNYLNCITEILGYIKTFDLF